MNMIEQIMSEKMSKEKKKPVNTRCGCGQNTLLPNNTESTGSSKTSYRIKTEPPRANISARPSQGGKGKRK